MFDFGSDGENKGSKVYTPEEAELILFGVSIGMSALGMSRHLPEAELGQAVTVLKQAMKDTIPSMCVSNERAEELRRNPTLLFSKDYGVIMKGVHTIFRKGSDQALTAIQTEKDCERGSPAEKAAAVGILKLKEYLTKKGYKGLDTYDGLMGACAALSPKEKHELAVIVESAIEETHSHLGVKTVNKPPQDDLSF